MLWRNKNGYLSHMVTKIDARSFCTRWKFILGAKWALECHNLLTSEASVSKLWHSSANLAPKMNFCREKWEFVYFCHHVAHVTLCLTWNIRQMALLLALLLFDQFHTIFINKKVTKTEKILVYFNLNIILNTQSKDFSPKLISNTKNSNLVSKSLISDSKWNSDEQTLISF